jgi:hypothetical protein
MVFSILFTVPVPIVLGLLFKRKKLEVYDNPDSIRRKLKVQHVKRGIAYTIAFLYVAWCFWSTLTFSLEFGFNTTQIWMINFGFSTAVEILLKDAIVAMSVSFIMILIMLCKQRCKKKRGLTHSGPQRNHNP